MVPPREVEWLRLSRHLSEAYRKATLHSWLFPEATSPEDNPICALPSERGAALVANSRRESTGGWNDNIVFFLPPLGTRTEWDIDMPETIASVSTATNRMTEANRGYTEERSEKVTYGDGGWKRTGHTRRMGGDSFDPSSRRSFSSWNEFLLEDRSTIGIHGVYRCLYTARELVPGEISISENSMANTH